MTTAHEDDGPFEPGQRRVGELPSARPITRFADRLDGPLAVFLDYDGTLTPIVDDPDAAELTAAMRATLDALAGATLVAVISGRDLDDVRARVGIDHIAYAGSHGLDLRHADGRRQQLATDHIEVLEHAQRVLEDRLADIAGVRIERKRFAIAVHDRQVTDPGDRQRIAAVVAAVAADEPSLRHTGGKRINELRPDIDWDKGRAIEALLAELDAEQRLPMYLGDDLTDEDGFRVVRRRGGIAVVVRGEDDDRWSLAEASLDDTSEAQRFLEDLLGRLGERPQG